MAYLRPETAQGIFVNFKNVQTTTRKKPPFGIAQIGKSFRNEITPGNFVFRTREFEQMEMEFFVPPEDSAAVVRVLVPGAVPLVHRTSASPRRCCASGRTTPTSCRTTASARSDVEFDYPWGWGELEGIANRTDYDLKQHGEFSGEDLSYFDQEHDRRYIPHVIEPAAGADRATLAFLLAAYHEEEAPTADGKVEKRTVLRLDPRLAPNKVAVLPLSKNEKLVPISDEVAADLRPHFMIDVDVAGSIGKRYRRQDEVGTPYCVTIDFDTLEDRAVTVRDRDSMTQDRVSLDRLVDHLRERLACMTSDHYELSASSPTRRRTRSRPRTAPRSRTPTRRARARAEPGLERPLGPDPAPALRQPLATAGDDGDDDDEVAERRRSCRPRRLTGARRGAETTDGRRRRRLEQRARRRTARAAAVAARTADDGDARRPPLRSRRSSCPRAS